MAKKGSTQTQTTTPDEFTDQARRAVWDRAMQAASQPYQQYGGQRVAGVDPMTMRGLNGAFDAIAGFQNYQPGNFLSGDISAYQNPYQQAVISGVQGDFDRIRQSTMGMVDDAAQRAGAFGGSRHGIATGQALGDVGRAEASQLAGLRSAGFNDAAGRMLSDQDRALAFEQMKLGTAGQLGNLGLAGGGYLRNIDQQGLDTRYSDFLDQQNWGVRNLGLLSGTLGGLPGGSSTTQKQSGSGLGGFLGGALSLGSMFLPGGGLSGILGGGGNPTLNAMPPMPYDIDIDRSVIRPAG